MKRMRLGLDRRGGVLAMVAVTMIVLLAVAALAVDLASAFSARNEAQRIADSAALAGGAAFMEYQDPTVAAPFAQDWAYDYALRNNVRGVPVDSSMVTVQVVTNDRLVRVWIQAWGLPTWFARILGIDSMDVNARAAAQASPAGAAKCLKPFAVPDMWDERGGDNNIGQDTLSVGATPGDNVWQAGEEWDFDPSVDHYLPYQPGLESSATGYGSNLRGGDYGRRITIKVSDPQGEYALSPGLFYPWRIPEDPNQGACDQGGGSGDQGGAVYRRNICECNMNAIQLGQPYDLEPGDMIGPTQQGVRELIAEDPNAQWVDGQGIVGSQFANPIEDSPRVIKIALFDISQITGPGMQSIVFNNFALLFLEAQGAGRDPVMGRFLWFADGTGAGPTTGSLVLYLRLVE